MRPVALGAAIGVAAALAASRVLASQLFNVSRTDPVTIGAVVAALPPSRWWRAPCPRGARRR